jgi:hypothetical protein
MRTIAIFMCVPLLVEGYRLNVRCWTGTCYNRNEKILRFAQDNRQLFKISEHDNNGGLRDKELPLDPHMPVK